jgi:hypothetical protein
VASATACGCGHCPCQGLVIVVVVRLRRGWLSTFASLHHCLRGARCAAPRKPRAAPKDTRDAPAGRLAPLLQSLCCAAQGTGAAAALRAARARTRMNHAAVPGWPCTAALPPRLPVCDAPKAFLSFPVPGLGPHACSCSPTPLFSRRHGSVRI